MYQYEDHEANVMIRFLNKYLKLIIVEDGNVINAHSRIERMWM
jgi:hypothetical protein